MSKTDDKTTGASRSLDGLVGKLVEMGDLHDSNGDLVRGVLIECSMDDLRDSNLRMYGMVSVSNKEVDRDE